jgi:DNA-binding response OmpR family regulator
MIQSSPLYELTHSTDPETKQEIGTREEAAVPRLLVFDDNPLFVKLVEKTAEKRGIPIITCTRMEEFALAALNEEFDIAIIDYNLDEFNGPTVAEVLEGQPALMISETDRGLGLKWPECFRDFINKSHGIDYILNAALTIAARNSDPDSEAVDFQKQLN